jgi:hypothetical protein
MENNSNIWAPLTHLMLREIITILRLGRAIKSRTLSFRGLVDAFGYNYITFSCKPSFFHALKKTCSATTICRLMRDTFRRVSESIFPCLWNAHSNKHRSRPTGHNMSVRNREKVNAEMYLMCLISLMRDSCTRS